MLARRRGARASERAALVRELVGDAREPPSPSGPRLRDAGYRFEIVSDYGAFRDLQRHRLLTCQWQRALAATSAPTCRTSSSLAGLGSEYERALEVSRTEYERLRPTACEEAPYALSLAYRIRYVLELDAREALHLIELRSGREGHPSYRAVAHEMRREIAAVHPNVAAAMTFVDDSTEERLERLLTRCGTRRSPKR